MNYKYELKVFKFYPDFILRSVFGIDDADTPKYIKEALDEDMKSLGITAYDFNFSEDAKQYQLNLFDAESTKKLIIASFDYDIQSYGVTIQEFFNAANRFFALESGEK